MNKKQLDKCKIVKTLVERFSGIKDIGVTSRERDISDMKKIYCKICHFNYNIPHGAIANSLRENYNRASVIHNIKEFDKLYPIKQLHMSHVFEDVIKFLINLENEEANKKLIDYSLFLDWVFNEIDFKGKTAPSKYVEKYFNYIN